jgi:hypothetical protein
MIRRNIVFVALSRDYDFSLLFTVVVEETMAL